MAKYVDLYMYSGIKSDIKLAKHRYETMRKENIYKK